MAATERKIIKRKWTKKICKNCVHCLKTWDALSCYCELDTADTLKLKTSDDPACDKFEVRVCLYCCHYISPGYCVDGIVGRARIEIAEDKPGCERFIYDRMRVRKKKKRD